jgi:hypothetical protein
MIAMLLLALGVSGCVSGETATRGAEGPDLTIATQGAYRAPDPASVPLAATVQVVDVRVAVPQSLRVSEANTFLPMADIVWRGDPLGDRHAQIAAIFQTAGQSILGRGAGRPVVAEIVVTRFHGVTEKTRYTVGGNHNMRFDLTLRDAATGAVVLGPREVVADVRASGGARAIEEDRIGRTQKVVVTERLMQVLQSEMGLPQQAAPVPAPELVAMR